MYCPINAVSPVAVRPGNSTLGPAAGRNASQPCPAGQYCPGDGYAYPCPAGTYGGSTGLANSSCSGPCAAGRLCSAGSTSPAGVTCPQGYFCPAGTSIPCPPGTYSSAVGAATSNVCTLCPAGRYGNVSAAVALSLCTACATTAGSNPGAVVCWPAIDGVCAGMVYMI